MRITDTLEPKSVLSYFADLCAIPHGSGNTKAISDYCVRFAESHGFEVHQDALNNVIIVCPATPGCESAEPVIIQGHLDMVTEKTADCPLDMTRDELDLALDGDYLYARGTTLGGDDGIAVAYALAVLDSSELKHPPLEAVFTVDEEIGMLGAAALDMSGLQGRVLLNIDSEDEGILTVSCAGGATSCLTVPVKRVPVQGNAWRVGVRGLTGGHSGVEINKGRANANKVLAAALQGLPVTLCSIAGGSKDNAIPRASEAVVVSEADDFAALFAANAAKAALPETEQHAEFYCEPAEAGEMLAGSEAVLGLLNAVPNGVQAMSSDIPGLVQTSLNLGILTTDADAVRLTFSVRSSVNREKFGLIAQLKALAARFGGSYSETGEYPAWEYQKDSRLREVMVEVFEAQYGRKPVVEAIHAGLECGIFSDRLPGLDAVSFGPQMHDIHTSRERLDIASTARTWEYLVAVLERL